MEYSITLIYINCIRTSKIIVIIALWKVSKYGDFSGPYFPVFGLNTEKYRPEKAPYLDAFHAMLF